MHLPAGSQRNLCFRPAFLCDDIFLNHVDDQLVITYRTIKNIGVEPEVEPLQLIWPRDINEPLVFTTNYFHA